MQYITIHKKRSKFNCYTGAIPPEIVFQVYFDAAKGKGMFMPELEEHNFWMSSVIALKVDDFISITSKLSGDFYAERDCK